ncbi:MAG: response regulator [bacterium]|nr:response regulator [bacterium]
MMSAHILIIDDAESMVDVLKLTLEFAGHHVTVATNGREGLEKCRIVRFDLIFCDIDMPEMNGLEFTRRFRAEIDPKTPLIILSAEEGGLIAQALAAGATTALSKPFEPIRLMKDIEQFLP